MTLRQFHHGLAVETRQQAEVKVSQLFEQREVGILDTALPAIAEASLHFLLNQARQVDFVGPTGRRRQVGLRPVLLMERRQLQLQQLLLQIVGGGCVHGCSPPSSWL